jgi:hypothetical protein
MREVRIPARTKAFVAKLRESLIVSMDRLYHMPAKMQSRYCILTYNFLTNRP